MFSILRLVVSHFQKRTDFFFFESFLTTVETFVPRVATIFLLEIFFPFFLRYKYAWFNSFSNLSIFNALFIFLINIFIYIMHTLKIFNLSQENGKIKNFKRDKRGLQRKSNAIKSCLSILIFQILLFFVPCISYFYLYTNF